MKCEEREKLFALAHRLLEPREEAEVLAHVAECSHCRGTLEADRKLDAVLAEWKPVEPSASFDARLRAAVQQSEADESASSWFDLRELRWLAPAFVLLLVVAASAMIVRVRQFRHAPRPSQVASKVTVSAPTVQAPAQPGPPEAEVGREELSLYQDLPVLENYDLLEGFEVLSELPKSGKQVEN